MSEKSASATSGIGFTGLLTVAFVVLKLCHIINWSWFWVLSPVIFGSALAILVIIFVIVLIAKH